jgi:hypothetical protein
MQVNATIIAAQQAAREARAALQIPKAAAPKTAASFLTELGEQAPASVRETKPAAAQTQAPTAPGPTRPGSLLDITI